MNLFRMYVTLPTELHNLVRETAKSEGLTLTAFVRRELILLCKTKEAQPDATD